MLVGEICGHVQAEARLEGLNQEEVQLQSALQGLAKQKVAWCTRWHLHD